MESNPPISPSPQAAREQLDALAASRGALADRLVTPRWYHPALAGLVFVFIGTAASARWWIVGFAVYCAGLAWLVTEYRRLTGLWTTGWSVPGGRGYATVLLVGLLAGLALSYAVRFDRAPWWCALLAAVGSAGLVLWVGPRYDAACRAGLRATT